MNRYPATRQPTRHLVLIAPNQYTLFGGQTIQPPTRPASSRPRPIGQTPTGTPPIELPEKRSQPVPQSRFRLDADTTAPTGQTARLRANLLAIETLKTIERENRPATDAEKQQLARYVGWGGLSALWKADCFADWQTDPNTPDEATQRWATRYGEARQRLSELLTSDEQTAAEASTLNAFYTAPLVVAEMWRAVQQLGFTGGHVLEPAAGIGCFVGLMPDAIRERSGWVAVEKDLLSARMLAALYPEAETLNTGLEQTRLADNSFDLVIGNVPFGGYSVYDKRHPELNTFPIHNYFVGRAVQLVKPGGLVALITSAGTLDAAGREFRQFLTIEAEAELAGAIRLPANTVEGNGGTQVTTDILFLRKRDGLAKRFPSHAFERTITIEAGLYQAEATEPDAGDEVRTLAVNEYYHARPEQMLGQMTFADRVGKGGLYRADQPTLHDDDPASFPARLAQVVIRLPSGCYAPSDQANQHPTPARADRALPNGAAERFTESVTIKGRRYSQRVIIEQYDRLRTTFADLRKAEQDNAPDCRLADLRTDLNRAYSLFVRCFGTLNRNRAVSFLEDYNGDGSPAQFALVQALEIVTRTERGATISKADIFTRRVYPASSCPDRVESLADALRLSVALFGTIRLDAVSRWTGRNEADTEQALLTQELAFRNPATGRLDDRDSYLSGDVRRKLAQATEAASREPAYAMNERALAAVMPPTVPAAAVQFRLGAVWIPARIIEAFIRHTLQTDAVRVAYNQRAGQYEIDGAGNVGTVQNRSLGTPRRTALQLIEAALQQRTLQITKTIIDGEGKERQVKDLEATSQAVQAQEQLNELFIDFVREQHSPTLETVYNELYNSHRHKTYHEPALAHYPGASPAVKLRFHQFRAVERIKEQDTLLAHAVGSGKSYTMIAAAMELKRLGLAHKPLIVVQNSTLNDFARSWRTLYPAAVIYVPQPADLQAANRKRFLQRIATNNFDGVLIPQSFLKLIPDDPASEEAVIQEEIERVAYMVAAAARQGKQKPMTVKRLNELKLRLATRRQRQADRQKDDMLTFDQLGIDALFLDEAHKYKRLGFFTLRQNVKGIDAAGSEDALSALFKCRTVQARQGRVVLATGTPISNTMAEAWTTLRFIAPQRLERAMLTTFDQFAGAFGTVIQSFELTATGNFKAVERFARFVNVQQLSELYRAHVDVVLNGDVVEFQQGATGGRSILPTLKDGAHTRLVLPQTEGVAEELDRIKETLRWFENLTGAEKRDHSYIPLVCFGQARKATLDIRLLDPTAPDEAGSKCNRAVAEIHRIYTATADYRGTQLVFADTYQSPAIRQSVTALTEDGLTDERPEANPVVMRFNLFAEIRAKLIAEGIPAAEIAIVPAEADKREPLFAQVRTGAVRVLLGTSERMGVGVNVQERLAAVHHLDAPNRPTDFEQRNGRLIRQGNQHAEWGIPVEVLTYGVERTLDATAYGRLAVKQKFINQVLKGHIADDQITDISADDDFSAMSFDQMMATLSGSQYALLYTTRQLELSRLVQARRNWQRGLMDAQAQVERAETFLRHSDREQQQLDTDTATLTTHFGTPYAVTSVTIGGATHTEKMGEAAQRLIEQVKASVKRHDSKHETMLVNGLPLTLTGERSVELVGELLPGQPVVRYQWGNLSGVVSSANGLFLSLKAAVARALQAPAHLAHEQQRARLMVEEYGRKLTQPFRQEAELHRLESEVADLKQRMETEGQSEPAAETCPAS